jgi:hypothetical protein
VASASVSFNSAGGTVTIPALNNGATTGTIAYSTTTGGTTSPITITAANYLAGISPVPPTPSGATAIYLVVSVANAGGGYSFNGTAGNIAVTLPNVANGTVLKAHVYEDPSHQGYVDIGTYPLTGTVTGGNVTFKSPFQTPFCTSGCGNTNPGPNPFFTNDSVMIIITN